LVKESHSIACGDDNAQQITTTTSTDARDMVKDLGERKTIANSKGFNTDATNTQDK